MGILDEDVQRVREATDIVDLVREHVALRRVGRRFSGLCPFHQEKTPSFSVNAEMGVFHCLAGETRVITWDGVKPIRELAGATHRILSTNGRWIDAPFYSFGVQPLFKITVGRNRVRKDIYATDGHRWFLRAYKGEKTDRVTADLRAGDSLCSSFPSNRMKQARPSPFGVVRGIVYGDGHRFNKGSAVDLHGEKNAQLLKWFPLSHTYACTYGGDRDDTYLKVVDMPAYFKDERPSLDESPSYLLGWLAGYFAADGCVAKDGTVTLNSANRDDLEYVRMLALRLGIGTYRVTTQLRVGLGTELPALHRIHFINEDLVDDFFLIAEHRDRFAAATKAWVRRGWVVKSVEPTDRVEEVFCAVVPDEHAFTLEDNILTGNCFGCQKSGDAITFVREVEHLDFVGAVERLAARANIQLRYDDANITKDRQRKNRLHEAVAAAIDFYHERLMQGDDARNARGYLRSRGFDGDAVRRFKLGYSPAGWDELARHLSKAKFSRDDIAGANLAFVNRANKLQDAFRDRLMFPIWDVRGDAVGFGGRALPDANGVAPPPKYKNTADTPIYRKSTLLYGLNWAKGEIVARGEVVICEGYTDVMAFHLAGVPNAVATCGTALADEHFVTLKNLARKITLAYDADAAGQAAAERAYQWEQRFDVSFQVADLPVGRDPGDLWHDDPGRLTKAVEGATPFMQFRLDRALAGADLSTIEGKARAANAAVAIIAQHPSDFVRDEYVMRAASTLRTDNVQRLREEVAKVRRGATPSIGARPSSEQSGSTAPRATPYDRRELDALRWIVHAPEQVAPHVHASLFTDARLRDAFELLLRSETFDTAVTSADDDTAALLHRLAVEEPLTGTDSDDVLASRVIVNLVEASSRRLIASMLRDGDTRSAAIKPLADALVRARDTGNWSEAVRVADDLVAWAASIGTNGEHRGHD